MVIDMTGTSGIFLLPRLDMTGTRSESDLAERPA
jgi:hypothetical protein